MACCPVRFPNVLAALNSAPAAIADHLVEELHDMKAVEDDGGVGQTRCKGRDIGQSHVDGHRSIPLAHFLGKRVRNSEAPPHLDLPSPQQGPRFSPRRQVIDQGSSRGLARATSSTRDNGCRQRLWAWHRNGHRTDAHIDALMLPAQAVCSAPWRIGICRTGQKSVVRSGALPNFRR